MGDKDEQSEEDHAKSRNLGNENPYIIIGPGALGVGLALALNRQGYAVRFLGRRGPLSFTARIEDGDSSQVCSWPAATSAELAHAAAVFIAVKAYHLETALRHVGALSLRAPVIPIGNGAVEDLVRRAARLYPQRIMRIGCATLAMSELPGESDDMASFAVRSHSGTVDFGSLDGTSLPTDAEKRIVEAPGPFRWHQDALAICRRKWLLNTVLNSLCAARRLAKNGLVLELGDELYEVMDEAYRLGQELWGPWSESQEAHCQQMVALIAATAENENSMARDVRMGLPTESAFLAGMSAGREDRYPRLTALHRWISAAP